MTPYPNKIKWLFILNLFIIPMLAYYVLCRAKSDWLLDDVAYQLQLPIAQFTTQSYRSLTEKINQSKRLTPNNAKAFLLAGNLKLYQISSQQKNKKRRFLQQAEKNYKKGLTYQPNNPFIWINMAIATQHTKELFIQAIVLANLYGPTLPEVASIITRLEK